MLDCMPVSMDFAAHKKWWFNKEHVKRAGNVEITKSYNDEHFCNHHKTQLIALARQSENGEEIFH